MSQKRKIKSDYLKNQSESQLEMSTSATAPGGEVKFSVASVKTNVSSQGQNPSRTMMNLSSDSGLASWKTSAVTNKTSKHSFFPKSIRSI